MNVDFIIGESVSFVNFMGKERGQKRQRRPKKVQNPKMKEGNKNPVCF